LCSWYSDCLLVMLLLLLLQAQQVVHAQVQRVSRAS
jgi:hypothetical protein